MDKDIINKIMKNLEMFNKNNTSTHIFIESFEFLKIRKDTCLSRVVFIFASLVIAGIGACQGNSMLIAEELVKTFLSIILAFAAIVFTGYVFMQVLITDRLLVAMMINGEKEENKLYETDLYFVKVMMFQLSCLILNLFILASLIILPEKGVIYSADIIYKTIIGVIIAAVLYYNLIGIWEIKSLVFNVRQLFNLHTYTRVVDIFDKQKGIKSKQE